MSEWELALGIGGLGATILGLFYGVYSAIRLRIDNVAERLDQRVNEVRDEYMRRADWERERIMLEQRFTDLGKEMREGFDKLGGRVDSLLQFLMSSKS